MPATPADAPLQSVPLCVDLDGTLIRTDLLWESVVQLLKRNPLYAFALPFWWLRGRACLKAQIALRTDVNVALLPYHPQLMDFLLAEKRGGRPIYLVTASDSRLAERVQLFLGLFDEVIASDGKTNLRGRTKGARLAARFGAGRFDYAGNSSVDLPVWQQARQAIVVNGTAKLAQKAGQLTVLGRIFEPRKNWWTPLARVLRIPHWGKNLIVFVPLLAAHQLANATLVRASLRAFLALSLCGSAVHILNDLRQLDSDRQKPLNRVRPFASGDLPLPAGLAVAPILLAGSALLVWSLPGGFALALAVYLVLALLYLSRLRQVALLDVLCVGALYAIRLFAGYEAAAISYSPSSLGVVAFIFLGLALVKRALKWDADLA